MPSTPPPLDRTPPPRSVQTRTPPRRSSTALRGTPASEWLARRGRLVTGAAPALLLADAGEIAGLDIARIWQTRTDLTAVPASDGIGSALLLVGLSGRLDVHGSADLPALRLEQGDAALLDGDAPLRLVAQEPSARLEIGFASGTVLPGCRLDDSPALAGVVAAAQRLLHGVASGSAPSASAGATLRLLLDVLADEAGR